MKILDRYLRKIVISTTLLVVLVFAAVEMFVKLINEFSDIGNQQYHISNALIFVFASLPKELYSLFPAAALVGCLVALGRLASNSELIVMRASGVSKAQITLSVMKAMLILLVCVTLVGEALGTKLKYFAENYKNTLQAEVSSPNIRQGVWLRAEQNFIHIDRILPSGQLEGILRYEFEGQTLKLASNAKHGEYKNSTWIFSDIDESKLAPNHVTTQHIDQQIWPISLDPKLVSIVIMPDQTSLWGLFKYIQYLKKSGLSSSAYEFAFWKRLFQPLLVLAMMGLTVPFIFGPLRSATMGSRILIGVVVGFLFFTLNEFLGPFSLVYQVAPILAAAIPIVICLGVDLALM